MATGRWTQTDAERFWDKVEVNGTDCWPWLASLKDTGYGQFRYNGRVRPAHRFAYELIIGPIPAGLVIDHLCRNRTCVNPLHLEPVTNEENIRRGLFRVNRPKPKTHCPSGHPYDEQNTVIRTSNGYGYRVCRTCERRHSLAGYYRRKGDTNGSHP